MDNTTADKWERKLDSRTRELASERWDCADGGPVRLRYAILAPQRTGSDLLCAYLRHQGLGLPMEYLNPTLAPVLAARFGTLDKEAVLALPYWKNIVAKRTKEGILGVKIQREQLVLFTQGKIQGAKSFIKDFDRFIVLRRHDKIMQAISLVRAMANEQWQVYAGEQVKGMPEDKAVMPLIADGLRKILDDEAYMEELVADIDPARVRRLAYDDVMHQSVLEATAAWLWRAAGVEQPPKPAPDATLDAPAKIDRGESRALKVRFLSRVGVW
jgi:LPS sulfotransferase NodH